MMNLKPIKSFFRIPTFGFVFLLLAVISCSKDENNYVVNVDAKEITLTMAGRSKELKVTSSGEWHFEAQGLQGGFCVNMGSTDWYTITPMYGKNNQTVTITLKEGVTTEKTTSLKLIGNNNTATVTLKFSAQHYTKLSFGQ